MHAVGSALLSRNVALHPLQQVRHEAVSDTATDHYANPLANGDLWQGENEEHAYYKVSEPERNFVCAIH